MIMKDVKDQCIDREVWVISREKGSTIPQGILNETLNKE